MICVADIVKWTKEIEFVNLISKARHRTKQSVNFLWLETLPRQEVDRWQSGGRHTEVRA
jgi:hypothetical protein